MLKVGPIVCFIFNLEYNIFPNISIDMEHNTINPSVLDHSLLQVHAVNNHEQDNEVHNIKM